MEHLAAAILTPEQAMFMFWVTFAGMVVLTGASVAFTIFVRNRRAEAKWHIRRKRGKFPLFRLAAGVTAAVIIAGFALLR